MISCGLKRSTRVYLFNNLSQKILDGELKEEQQLGEVQIALGRKGTYQVILMGGAQTAKAQISPGLREPAREKGLEQGYEHLGKFHASAKTGSKHSLGKKA